MPSINTTTLPQQRAYTTRFKYWAYQRINQSRILNYSLNAFGSFAAGVSKNYCIGRSRSCHEITSKITLPTYLEIREDGIYDHQHKLSTNLFLVEAFLKAGVTKIKTTEGLDAKDLIMASRGVESLKTSLVIDAVSTELLLPEVEEKNLTNLAKSQLIAATLAGLSYALYRSATFALYCGAMTTADIIASTLLVVGVLYGVVLQAIKHKFLLGAPKYIPPKVSATEKKEIVKKGPPVSVLIPAYEEPVDVLEATLTAATKLNYGNYEIVLLQDSPPGSDNLAPVRRMVERLNASLPRKIKIFERKQYSNIPNQRINKADNVNAFLRFGIGQDLIEVKDDSGNLRIIPADGEYRRKGIRPLSYQVSEHVVIIDADYELFPNFLQETIPILERDKNVAYVMTPQNIPKENPNQLEDANILLTHFTWHMLHKGVAHNGKVLFGGTNAAIRLSALKDIAKRRESGAVDLIPSDTVTEDLSASLYLFEKGYNSAFIPTPLAKGQPIHCLADHFSTYWRYTEGSLENTLKQTIPYIYKNPKFFTSWESAEYINKGLQAFYGAMVGFFSIAPFLSLQGISFPASVPIPILLYFLFMSNSAKTLTRQLGRRGPADHLKSAALFLIHFPVFIHGFASGIKNVALGKRAAFQRTNKDGNRSMVPLKYLLPLLAAGASNIYASIGSLYYYISNPSALGMLENFAWASFQSLGILGSLFWFNGVKNTFLDLVKGSMALLDETKESAYYQRFKYAMVRASTSISSLGSFFS